MKPLAILSLLTLFAQLQAVQTAPPISAEDAQCRWSTENSALAYVAVGGEWMKIDCSRGTVQSAEAREVPHPPARPRPGRGQSFREANSPNGELTLQSAEGNLRLLPADKSSDAATVLLGDNANRRQVGAVSWVYGEEWGQTDAMGWSPDSKRFWFYEFDNSKVMPFDLITTWTTTRSVATPLDYPKAGEPNPVVSLWWGAPGMSPQKLLTTGTNDREYIIAPKWINADELIYQTANRKQNQRSLLCFNARTGKTTLLWDEQLSTGYVPSEWNPEFLSNNEILLKSEMANGFANFVLVTTDGKSRSLGLIPGECTELNSLTETRAIISATGWNSKSPQQSGVYVVDRKKGTSTLWSPKSSFTKWFGTRNGTFAVVLTQEQGSPIRVASVDLRKAALNPVKLKEIPAQAEPRVRAFPFKSADQKFDLVMQASFPDGYQEGNKLPVMVDVYNGPETSAVRWMPTRPNSFSNSGFIGLAVESRGGLGRGAAFRNSQYQKLGIAEIDDIAAAVKELIRLGYADPNRIAISGTSYGGYTSLMCLLRYPDLFQAAIACSPVTDWKHYDTIYTERYMGLPADSKEAYSAGSAMTYVKNYKGSLLLFFGMRDDNVHPNNSMELIQAMRVNGKFPDIVIGPNDGHAGLPLNQVVNYARKAFAKD